MKNTIVTGIIAVFGLLASQSVQAQGTITYLSNLGQTSTGSSAVGSDSWVASTFTTGSNAGGYDLNSVQLAMTDASGNPNGFTVMVYTEVGITGSFPGSSLGSLSGSASPMTAGTYTYTAPANLTLSPNTGYFIVLAAGTTIATGAYDWSVTSPISYNPSGGWGGAGGFWESSNGSSWQYSSGAPQFAINAMAVPEPSAGWLALAGGGGLIFGLCRRKRVA